MVPTPIELEGPNTSAIDVNSSGADDPAARNVAPATSGVSSSTCRNENMVGHIQQRSTMPYCMFPTSTSSRNLRQWLIAQKQDQLSRVSIPAAVLPTGVVLLAGMWTTDVQTTTFSFYLVRLLSGDIQYICTMGPMRLSARAR